jgi:hypothetical protein
MASRTECNLTWKSTQAIERVVETTTLWLAFNSHLERHNRTTPKDMSTVLEIVLILWHGRSSGRGMSHEQHGVACSKRHEHWPRGT